MRNKVQSHVLSLAGAMLLVAAVYLPPVSAATLNHPPTISGTPETTVRAGTAYTFEPTAQDPDEGDTLTFSIKNKPGWMTLNTATGALTGTPAGKNAKTYSNIIISVKDSKRAKAFLPPFDLTVTNDAPTISGEPATTANTGQRYRFAPSASDPNGDKLKFTVSRLPTWATFSAFSGVLTGIPTDDNIGSYRNIVITVNDGNIKTSLPPFSIEVGNPPPVITGAPTANIKSGKTYRFQPTVSDPNKPASGFIFNISGKPDWANFDATTGKLEGVPVSDRTVTYAGIVISVSDGYSTVSLPPFSITVLAGSSYSACEPEISTGMNFSCQLPGSEGAAFSLNNPQQGMAIQPKTGILHWTPTSLQTGQYYAGVSIKDASGNTQQLTVPLNVLAGEPDPAGIYVAIDGSDNAGAGSAAAPFASVARAAKNARPGDVIYLRGGVYYNEEYGQPFDTRQYGGMARITTSGTGPKPITLRPYGNEYVKLISDVDVLQFKNAQYWTVEGLELEGMARSTGKDDVMALWWEDGNDRKITGRGVSTNSSQNITVRNNVIHDFAGAGVGNNGSDMITVENNVIYNNGWWSTAGTHGVSNSYLTTVSGNEGKQALAMTGNLVFGNQSRVISHVFSKGNVDLAIDEGNGLHAQNNSETFLGKALVENNLLMFNGKAGFGINTMDAVRVINNAFYQNAQVVNTGELAVQSSAPTAINGNLFQPMPHRNTLKDSDKDYDRMKNNASTYGADAADMPVSTLFTAVFQNPEAMDLTPAAGIPEGMGVPSADLQRMMGTISEYGIKVKAPALEVVDESYLADMKQIIFSSWPETYGDITLTDRNTGYVYNYEQRCSWPETPAVVACP